MRCLMDGGSQQSFVLQKQVKTLGLPVMKKETLKRHTFGSNIPVTMESIIVKLVLPNIGNKELNTASLPKVRNELVTWKPSKTLIDQSEIVKGDMK